MAVIEEDLSPRELVEKVFERLDERDADTVLEFGAEDEVTHWPLVGRIEGNIAVRNHFASIFAAFPDFHIEIERIVAEGEAVFVHWHITGTFTGDALNGVAATGRPIDIRGTDYFIVGGGKIVSNFIAYDGMDFARQTGMVPAAEGA